MAEPSLSDLFCHLSLRDRHRFRAPSREAGWPCENAIRFGTEQVPVLSLARGELSAAGQPAALVKPAREALRQWAGGASQPFFLAGALLVAVLPGEIGQTGAVCVLSPGAVAAFLSEQFPAARTSPVRQRLLTCLLAGLTIVEAARLDRVSTETRKSQAADLRMEFDVASVAELQRMVGARLTDAIRSRLVRQENPGHGAFFDHMARFYPAAVRALVLQNAGGLVLRYLDMGPRQGLPVIVLHPLILPPVTAADLDHLDRLGLRLLWPLRPGLLAPGDPILSEAATISQAVASVELVRQSFCEGPCHILAVAGGARAALAYAERHPRGVRGLTIAAACAPVARRKDGAHRLVNGATALLRRSAALTRAGCDFVATHVLTERRFPAFIRRQFATSAADLAVIEGILADPVRAGQMREALRLSVNAIVSDFAFQAEPAWHLAAGLGGALHFVHGAQDATDTPRAIRALANGIPGARLTILPEAGQLFFGPHLRRLLDTVACDAGAAGLADGKRQVS